MPAIDESKIKTAFQIYLNQIGKALAETVQFELTRSARLYDRNRNSLSASNLYNSIEPVLTDTGIRIVGNFYWQYIEGGRRPGTRPPFSALLNWANRYRIRPRDGESVNQLIYRIQSAIYKQGIKPRPFIDNALQTAEIFENPFEDQLAGEILRKAFGL